MFTPELADLHKKRHAQWFEERAEKTKKLWNTEGHADIGLETRADRQRKKEEKSAYNKHYAKKKYAKKKLAGTTRSIADWEF